MATRDEYCRFHYKNPILAGLEPEILDAARGGEEVITTTENILEKLTKLDKLLKEIKVDSPGSLKERIEDARGVMSFCDSLETDITDEILNKQTLDVKAVKSTILGTVVRTLAGSPDVDEWFKSEINIRRPNEKDCLLSRAIGWGVLETVQLLLACGADPRNHGINWDETLINETYDEEVSILIHIHLFLWFLPEKNYIAVSDDDGDFPRRRRRKTITIPFNLPWKDQVAHFKSKSNRQSRFTWIHVPRNNILMIMSIVRIFGWGVDRGFEKAVFTLLHDSDDPLLTYLEPSYQSRDLHEPGKTLMDQSGVQSLWVGLREIHSDKWSAIVFPYLVLTTIEQQEKKREEQKSLQRELDAYEDLITLDHLARTLDESYYPGLSPEALDVRNHDQVVSHSKDTFESYDRREKSIEATKKTAFILMVPQLWLFKLGHNVISAYNMPQGTKFALDEDEEEEEEDIGQRYRPPIWELDPDIHLGLIITGFIDRFGKGYTRDAIHYPPPLDLFETRVVHVLSEVRSYIEKPPGGNSSFSAQEYRRERYFIHVISDVRSELAMIQHTLEQQERVLKQFLGDRLPESLKQFSQDWAQIESSQETIRQYMRRVEKIDSDAERIEKSIQDMLNLKRTHASIRDAHSSLIVSTAVIGFTVITIVFTPLAFVTALFALKIDGFESLQVSGSDGIYHRGKIGGVFVSTEILTLGLTIGAVWLAFKYIGRDEEYVWRKEMAAWLKNLIAGFVGVVTSFGGVVTRIVTVVMLIAWFRGPSSMRRVKVPDPESPKQVNQAESTANSSNKTMPVDVPPATVVG